MPDKEAKARKKINKLLEESGWRLLDCTAGIANVDFEGHVKFTEVVQGELGEDFEHPKGRFVDYLLLDEKSFPIILLEAKSESKNPINGNEQAGKYVKSQNCRFEQLTNGNLHYIWDVDKSSPRTVSKLPDPSSEHKYTLYKPNPNGLVQEILHEDYTNFDHFKHILKV